MMMRMLLLLLMMMMMMPTNEDEIILSSCLEIFGRTSYGRLRSFLGRSRVESRESSQSRVERRIQILSDNCPSILTKFFFSRKAVQRLPSNA